MEGLKRIRRELGMSQKQVAEILGVSAPTVSEWESGKKRPGSRNLTRLAELLGASTDAILGRVEEKQEAPWGDAQGVPVTGEEMAPTLQPGDWAYVREGEVRSGQIAALRVEGELRFARVYWHQEGLLLTFDAPSTPPMGPVRPEDWEILGRVVGYTRLWG